MAFSRKAAAAGIALVLSAGLLNAPAAQAHDSHHPIHQPEAPIEHPHVPAPPVHPPKHPDRHEQRHYDNFTHTHHAEGGVWKYGLRDGFWFSEYYHPTKCHTANIHVRGYEIKRKADAGEWATARIPQFLGSPGLGYTTEC